MNGGPEGLHPMLSQPLEQLGESGVYYLRDSVRHVAPDRHIRMPNKPLDRWFLLHKHLLSWVMLPRPRALREIIAVEKRQRAPLGVAFSGGFSAMRHEDGSGGSAASWPAAGFLPSGAPSSGSRRLDSR